MFRFRLRCTQVLGCVALGAIAVPAFAEDDPAIPMTVLDQAGSITRTSVVPAHRGIAAADPAGLDRRLAVAVREVCGYHSMHGIRPPADYERCRAAAIADARRQAGPRVGTLLAALDR